MPILIEFLLGAQLTAGAEDSKPPAQLKTIELEWEEVPGAAGYVVKLEPEPPGGKPLTFTTQEPHLVEQVPVGTYQLRVRSKSREEGLLSDWSQPIQLEVLIKEVRPISPEDKAVLQAADKATQEVEFSWTPVEKVKEYTITIWTNEEKDKPLIFTTRETRKRLNVKTGRDYSWEVRFESSTEISYAQLPAVFTFTLLGRRLIQPGEIKITRVGEDQVATWNPSAQAAKYRIKLSFRFLDEKEFRIVRETTVPEPRWNAGRLAAGFYKIEVIATSPQHTASPPGTYEVQIKPTAPELSQLTPGL